MESLLSLSFDNISSRDTGKIRKGIKQIEGLLAQICLSKGGSRTPHKRKSSVLFDKPDQHSSPKRRADLRHDPAFREFFRLQESFQWNVASRLIATLECLLGMGNPTQTDFLILSSLDLLQGILVLHPPSRCLFAHATSMNLLLDLLDASSPPAVQAQTLLVLVAALLDSPANARVFEATDGLLTVTSLFKSRAAPHDVKMRSLEFVYFYLLPETPTPSTSLSAPNTAIVPRSPSKRVDSVIAEQKQQHHARTHSGDGGAEPGRVEMDIVEDADTRTTEEKQRLLGRYLPNAADIAQDLRNSAPFGGVIAMS